MIRLKILFSIMLQDFAIWWTMERFLIIRIYILVTNLFPFSVEKLLFIKSFMTNIELNVHHNHQLNDWAFISGCEMNLPEEFGKLKM